jgi:hypothetical protein
MQLQLHLAAPVEVANHPWDPPPMQQPPGCSCRAGFPTAGPSSCPYSPKYVEEEFCEVHQERFIMNSSSPFRVHTGRGTTTDFFLFLFLFHPAPRAYSPSCLEAGCSELYTPHSPSPSPKLIEGVYAVLVACTGVGRLLCTPPRRRRSSRAWAEKITRRT